MADGQDWIFWRIDQILQQFQAVQVLQLPLLDRRGRPELPTPEEDLPKVADGDWPENPDLREQRKKVAYGTTGFIAYSSAFTDCTFVCEEDHLNVRMIQQYKIQGAHFELTSSSPLVGSEQMNINCEDEVVMIFLPYAVFLEYFLKEAFQLKNKKVIVVSRSLIEFSRSLIMDDVVSEAPKVPTSDVRFTPYGFATPHSQFVFVSWDNFRKQEFYTESFNWTSIRDRARYDNMVKHRDVLYLELVPEFSRGQLHHIVMFLLRHGHEFVGAEWTRLHCYFRFINRENERPFTVMCGRCLFVQF